MIFPRPFESVGWALALMGVLGFFLPWLKQDTVVNWLQHSPAAAVEELAQERPWWQEHFLLRDEERRHALAQPLQGVSGFQLLSWIRERNPRQLPRTTAASFLLGAPDTQERGLLLMAFPVVALLSAVMLSLRIRNALLLLLPLGGCAALYFMTRARINETYFERLVSNAQVGIGLWIALYALLGLGALLLVRLLISLAGR